ncbi:MULTISPECIES: oligosaccharide flippase family protein [unclassified Pseudoalteromonas]|uniref:lipopolysaccharide biosynthesis protein n=1 Tax=unclassified Pseudoalteromonas TaxID=194690 RepID=UPI0015F77362|nr:MULTISPECIES: oligosaccharide flippase family protein [unclassified Pseudoalteromonas]MBA6409107.1 oligosaccharide flippase family protein [Pseudoalteromonas sp. 5Ae-yellow]MDN3389519.1 oligosaccharide flippase family protein [Pseudoalteromonas sp. APC 3691]
MLRNTLIYTLSSIASSAIPFILLPILTRYLEPEEYGQIAMFGIFTTALSSLIGLSVYGAANRRYFDEKITSTELARFNGNCFLILVGSTLISVIILALIDGLLAAYLGIPLLWVYLGLLSVFCSFTLNIRLGQWQIRGRAKSYGTLQVTNALVVLLFSLLLVVLFELGPNGRIYGIVITSIIIGIISYFTLRNDKLVIFEYNKADIKYALSFGIPLIPHVLGGFLLLSIDRLVINKELGLEMTGIYMVAVNLGNALNIVFNSINKAYSPWLFGKLKENDNFIKKSIVKKTYIYFLFLTLLIFLSFLIAPAILKLIVGEQFHEAARVLPFIVTGQVFLGMYFMVTNYIFYIKKTKYLSYVTITSGALNIVLLLILIPNYGLIGAALAFLIANFCQFIFTWLISAKLFDMPWRLKEER